MQQLTGISAINLGLTLMSVVTTLPETVVALTAAGQGKPELAVGSAIGSMAFNLAVVLAIYLLARATVPRQTIRWQSLFLFLALGALLLFCLNGHLGVWESLALCFIFGTFLLTGWVRPKTSTPGARPRIPGHWWLVLLAGAALLTLGAFLIVSYSEVIGAVLHIPQNIMAIVLVATGISLPEFFIALMAVRRRQGDLALGNIIGSCMINATLVLGSVGLIAGDLLVSASTLRLSLPFLLLASVVALGPLLVRQKTSKICGIVLMVLYVFYLISLYM